MNYPGLYGARYRPIGEIGQGGVARILLAVDLFTSEQAVLKMALDGNPEAPAAIRSEFRFAMTHRHPGLLGPIGLFEDDGKPVLVMPYLKGITPGKLQNVFDNPSNSANEHRIENIIVKLLEIASFIHFSGYVYNDFKPSNFIWLESNNINDEDPVLLDFNLVSVISEPCAKSGTIEYAAPEILLGRPPSPASDLYSLGATIYELFAARPPYQSDESPVLIKQITESGRLNLAPIPERFKEGLSALLSRDPLNRPQNAFEAARAFSLEQEFKDLVDQRASSFLTAGNPPFAECLKKALYEYLTGKSEKVFLVVGSGRGSGELDFLSAEIALDGYRVVRLWQHYAPEIVTKILDNLQAQSDSGNLSKTILVADDLSDLDAAQRSKLRALMRQPRYLPVISSATRWVGIDFSCQVYDPLLDRSCQCSSSEVISTYLKKKISGPEFDTLANLTGGDPELILLRLLSLIKSGKFDLWLGDFAADLRLEMIPEIEAVVRRALEPLDLPKREMLSILAVWGSTIPLILLADFSDEQSIIIDSLLSTGHLKRNKDSISFPSDDYRQCIYSWIPDNIRKSRHRLWAEAAEKFLNDPEELMEMAALHWGRSDNPGKGYEANLVAANEMSRRSDLARAYIHAERLLQLAHDGGGSVPGALMLAGDIQKLAGDYHSARRHYLSLLRFLEKKNNLAIRAETFKDLGDLYRSTKKTRRALYYIRKASALFEKLGCEQGTADCHNNIGLILWVSQEYEKALESFAVAFEINSRLGNFLEQAKIQSNIGIIKDIMGRPSEVAVHFEKAISDSRKAGDFRLESLFSNNLGYFYIRQNDLTRARDCLCRALEISSKIGYTESAINALSNLGLCDLKSGSLLDSIEYCQKALQMAESIGNRHLASDAQLFLAEIGILMGNYALADNVLSSLEKDQIYLENRLFAAQADILRSRLLFAINDSRGAQKIADNAGEYARSVGDSRLRLEAGLVHSLSSQNENLALQELRDIEREASALGHNDLADEASLALVRLYFDLHELAKAETRNEQVLCRECLGRRLRLEGRLLQGIMKAVHKKYDMAITTLTEVEAEASRNGFLPFALYAVTELAEIYFECGKTGRGRETAKRAQGYADRIRSTYCDLASQLSSGVPRVIARFQVLGNRQGECQIVEMGNV